MGGESTARTTGQPIPTRCTVIFPNYPSWRNRPAPSTRLFRNTRNTMALSDPLAGQKPNRSLATDCRDLVHTDVRGWHLHHGRPSFASVSTTGMVIHVHTQLVGPKNLRVFLGRALFNGRISHFEPLFDFVRALFPRMPRRFLGSVAPAPQTLPDRSFCQFDIELIANRMSSRIARSIQSA